MDDVLAREFWQFFLCLLDFLPGGMSLASIKIAVIHPQPLYRWGLASASRMVVPAQCVGSACFSALELSRDTINILVLASSLDDDEVEAIRRARREKRLFAVVDLSGETSLADLPGYQRLSQDTSIEEFAATLEEVIDQLHRERDLARQLGRIMLTRREQEVLHHLGEGLKTTQIAGLMEVSRKTIDAHLANIRERLGLTSTRALAQWAALRRAGLQS